VFPASSSHKKRFCVLSRSSAIISPRGLGDDGKNKSLPKWEAERYRCGIILGLGYLDITKTQLVTLLYGIKEQFLNSRRFSEKVTHVVTLFYCKSF